MDEETEAPGWNAQTTALVSLLVIALVFVAYVARAFLIPIAAAVFINFLLSPLVRWLRRAAHLPTAVGAALVMMALIGALSYSVQSAAGPAGDWVQRMPKLWSQLSAKVESIKQPLQDLSAAGEEIEEMTSLNNEKGGKRRRPLQIAESRGTSYGRTLLTQGWQAALSLIITLLLSYLMLAADEAFLHRMVEAAPTLSRKKALVTSIRSVEEAMAAYLGAISAINIGLGIVVGLLLWAAGMPNPALFGGLAAIVNFVPYLGPLVGIGIVGLVAVASFDGFWQMALPPGLYIVANTIEAYAVTPTLLGRRLALNPIVVLVSVLLWGWLWGVIGAFLAIPITMTIWVACNHNPGLRPVAVFLGGEVPHPPEL